MKFIVLFLPVILIGVLYVVLFIIPRLLKDKKKQKELTAAQRVAQAEAFKKKQIQTQELVNKLLDKKISQQEKAIQTTKNLKEKFNE